MNLTVDVPSLRSDTPGVANVLHFNNAGAALPLRPVLDAVTSHLAREAAIGDYEAAAEAKGRIADVYDAIANGGPKGDGCSLAGSWIPAFVQGKP
jgi:cysteine desulfurase/selenocysteine lyase